MAEYDETNGDISEIPEEQATDQRSLDFQGDDLTAALTSAGVVYVSLPGICKALGIKSVRGQVQRINRTKSLQKGLRRIPLETRGGTQPVNCLRVDKVALWLAGIETTRLEEKYREKIEIYQEELAPVAMQVFMHVMGFSASQAIPTDDPRVIALAEQIDTLTGVTQLLYEHMKTLLDGAGHNTMQLDHAIQLLEALTDRQEKTESKLGKIEQRTNKLTPPHKREVQRIVERVVREISKRNTNMSLPEIYGMVYGRIKTHFGAGKYDEIRDDDYNMVMDYLQKQLQNVLGGEEPRQGSLF